MTFNSLKIISILFILQALPFSVSAVTVNPRPIAIASEFTKVPFPLKKTKDYNESNDPAFKRCGTNSDGPQHGFFAVPLLVLGFAGVLLYFSKRRIQLLSAIAPNRIGRRLADIVSSFFLSDQRREST